MLISIIIIKLIISECAELWGGNLRVSREGGIRENYARNYVKWMFRLDFCTPRYIWSPESLDG